MTASPLYSIHVIEYAFAPARPIANYVYGAGEGLVDVVFSFALIVGDGHVALVDTGYENDGNGRMLGEASRVEHWISPSAALARIGVSPDDVTHVFLTHAHFDHIGGMALFPSAAFYLQERELVEWEKALRLPRRFHWLTDAIDPADIARAREYADRARLTLLAGPCEDVLPGIDLFPAWDTHTAGSQYLLVRNDGRRGTGDSWVLAGDLVYRFENLNGGNEAEPFYVPVGYAQGSQTNNVMALEELSSRVSGDIRRIIPFHENRLRRRFRSRVADDGLAVIEIAVGEGDTSRI